MLTWDDWMGTVSFLSTAQQTPDGPTLKVIITVCFKTCFAEKIAPSGICSIRIWGLTHLTDFMAPSIFVHSFPRGSVWWIAYKQINLNSASLMEIWTWRALQNQYQLKIHLRQANSDKDLIRSVDSPHALHVTDYYMSLLCLSLDSEQENNLIPTLPLRAFSSSP